MSEEAEATPSGVEELFCFLHPEMVCGPSCMAYRTFTGPDTAGILSVQQKHCTLLTTAEQASRHLVILANLLSKRDAKQRTAAADAEREKASQPASKFPYTR